MKIGWACMMNTLSMTSEDSYGFEYGCRSAGWTEWVFALSTWLAGLGQFGYVRCVKSSAAQFAVTIMTTLFAFACYAVFHGDGVHSAANGRLWGGLGVALLFSLFFYAGERDLQEKYMKHCGANEATLLLPGESLNDQGESRV